jgi:hypothetical protein
VQILVKIGGLKDKTFAIKLDRKYSRKRLDLTIDFIDFRIHDTKKGVVVNLHCELELGNEASFYYLRCTHRLFRLFPN